MRLATIRQSHQPQVAARIDSPIDATVLSATRIPGCTDVKELLECDNWHEIAAKADGPTINVERSQLAPVIPKPDKVICVGLNYAKHITEMGRELPEVPTLFIKFAEALTGPYDPVHVAPWAQSALDWEGELAVIIGTTARRVSEEEAYAHIAGYAVINDYTNREFQNRTLQWHQGKSLERTAGFGPWLTTADSWHPGGRLETFVDKQKMQSAPTDDLVFSPAKLVSFISQLYPLRPGDVIATGTPDGVGHAREPQRYLDDGETVRVHIEGLGYIENQTLFD